MLFWGYVLKVYKQKNGPTVKSLPISACAVPAGSPDIDLPQLQMNQSLFLQRTARVY